MLRASQASFFYPPKEEEEADEDIVGKKSKEKPNRNESLYVKSVHMDTHFMDCIHLSFRWAS